MLLIHSFNLQSNLSNSRNSRKFIKQDPGKNYNSDTQNEFGIKILAKLQLLRQDENFCDVELYSGENLERNAAIKAHRFVLEDIKMSCHL